MKHNPIKNALLAALYITLLVTGVHAFAPQGDAPEPSLIVPIAMLSLFTLSVAVMGYLFVYEPLCLYIDGEKKQGARLFLQTLGTFAVITAVLLLISILTYSRLYL